MKPGQLAAREVRASFSVSVGSYRNRQTDINKTTLWTCEG